MKLTQERLKELLHYDPDTGIFTWKVSLSRSVKVGFIVGSFSGGYLVTSIYKKIYPLHRLAFLYMEGYFPEYEVDHINRDTKDNRWGNLREVSHSCNMRNARISKSNTSGVVGVYKARNKKSYCSFVTVNRKTVHLGTTYTFEEAVRARWEAEKKYNYPSCNSTSSAYLWLKERGLIEEVKCNVK